MDFFLVILFQKHLHVYNQIKKECLFTKEKYLHRGHRVRRDKRGENAVLIGCTARKLRA